ncbi:hypothetical protein GQ54DRAFT_323574 [Martensiomyces pterosporus]|nr:hypothetical protein GQ54DRAFT_323574 [Martensiomyces pterosporus]
MSQPATAAGTRCRSLPMARACCTHPELDMFELVHGHKRGQAVGMWKLSCCILALALSVSAIEVYGEEMAEAARGAEPLLDSHGPEHLIGVLVLTTNVEFQTAGMGGLGYGFKTLDTSNIMQHGFKPRFWKMLPLGVNYKFDEDMGVLREIVQACIDQHRNPPDAASIKKGLLGYMLSAQAPYSAVRPYKRLFGKHASFQSQALVVEYVVEPKMHDTPDKNSNLAGLGNGLIFGQILGLRIAGYETPTSTLAWVLCLLVKHPGIQQCVVQEHVGVRITPGTTPNVKHVNQSKYLRQLTMGVLCVLPSVPVVSISTGTEISPFNGFLQEMQGPGSSSAELCFCCHNPEYDCLYNGEFEAYVEGGTLTMLHPAISHIGDARKCVHHRTTADDISIWKHLNEKNSRIHVCGLADG